MKLTDFSRSFCARLVVSVRVDVVEVVVVVVEAVVVTVVEAVLGSLVGSFSSGSTRNEFQEKMAVARSCAIIEIRTVCRDKEEEWNM
uniref:Uncharacterized protein n=1 Tax=Bursaphelenchus xylophilus TaxID=6326 RepID=A0A1I7RYV8_BURXY